MGPGPGARPLQGDRVALAAYLGGSGAFDQAIADFAETYAEPERGRLCRVPGRRERRQG